MLTIANADARHIPLPDKSVQCVVTSPPYWGLRDYGVTDQIGLERTPSAYVASIVAVMRECWRVLKPNGVLWLNLGDSYAAQGGDHAKYNANQPNVGAARCHANGSGDKGTRRPTDGLKPKDLVGIPWRVAFALQGDGWYLRQDIIWHKPNPMPESVMDRCTKAHEYVFLLSKSARYYYDAEAISEPAIYAGDDRGSRADSRRDIVLANSMNGKTGETRNRRSVWTVATSPYSGAHFATFPPALIEPMILAGSRRGDVVLDPFAGSGTTGRVAVQHGRRAVMLDLNLKYIDLQFERTNGVQIAMLT